jgi:cold-inducible RNA-binding protein
MSVQEHTVMRLYVGGLPYQTTEQELIDMFEQVGRVTTASVITDRNTGRSKGFGFVQMDNEQEAQSAITQLNGTTMGDRTLTVNQAHERESSSSRNSRY